MRESGRRKVHLFEVSVLLAGPHESHLKFGGRHQVAPGEAGSGDRGERQDANDRSQPEITIRRRP